MDGKNKYFLHHLNPLFLNVYRESNMYIIAIHEVYTFCDLSKFHYKIFLFFIIIKKLTTYVFDVFLSNVFLEYWGFEKNYLFLYIRVKNKKNYLIIQLLFWYFCPHISKNVFPFFIFKFKILKIHLLVTLIQDRITKIIFLNPLSGLYPH